MNCPEGTGLCASLCGRKTVHVSDPFQRRMHTCDGALHGNLHTVGIHELFAQ